MSYLNLQELFEVPNIMNDSRPGRIGLSATVMMERCLLEEPLDSNAYLTGRAGEGEPLNPISHIRPVPPSWRRPTHRRTERREPLEAQVDVLEPVKGTGVTINGSASGLRVAVGCMLPVGQICLVRVSQPFGVPRVERARVVWTRELPDGCIAGLQLIERH